MPVSTRPSILAVSIAALVLTSGAKASTISWDGEGANSLWATPTNWFNSTSVTNNVLPTAADDLVFGLGAAGTIDLGGAQTAKSIYFSLDGFTLGLASTTNVLTNTSGQITIDPGVTARINAILASSNGLELSGGGSLVLAGANSFIGTANVLGGSTLTISSDGNLGVVTNGLSLDGGTLNATAAITSARQLTLGPSANVITVPAGASVWTGQITGAGGFTKNGTGSLQIGGSTGNTFTGEVGVNNGTLFLNKTAGNAIGAGGLLISSDSATGFGPATVTLQASEQIDNNAPVTIDAKNTVTGGATNRAALDLSGRTETIGSLTMNTTTTGSAVVVLGANGKLVLNGDLFFNHNRNATGNSGRELLITGSGNFTTAGVGGTLDLGGVSRTISVNSNFGGANLTGADATIEAVITNGSLVKSGTQGLRLGAVNTYSGSTTVTGGTLRALVAGAIPSNSDIFIKADFAGTTATLDLNNTNLTPKSLTFGGGSGANTLATGTGTLTLAGNIGYDATNDPQTSTLSGRLDFGGSARTFNIADSAGTATELVISAAISGPNTGITKTGSGTLVLSGANTYTGPVTINGGALTPRAVNALGGSVTVNSGGVLLMDNGGADSTAFNNFFGAQENTINFDGGTFRANGTGDRTITNRTLNIGAGGATFDIAATSYDNFNEVGVHQVRFAGTSTLVGSGAVVKDGGGRIQFQTAAPNFSGPVTINNGTAEISAGALGNGAATNTLTINGGNVALNGDLNQPTITLNGGAFSPNGGVRNIVGTLAVNSASYLFTNDFYRDNGGANGLTFSNVISGSGDLTIAVNRLGYDANSGVVTFQNAGNTLSGTVTVGKNLSLTSSPSTGVGSTLGTANLVLANGKLNLRDNGAGDFGTLAYGNNVTVTTASGMTANGDLAGISTIDVNRAGGTNIGNTFQFGTLSVDGQQLNVSGGNGYGVRFNGLTTLTGNATFNVSNTTLTLAGGITADAGQTFTKDGNGTLRFLSTPTVGYTHTAGTIELPDEPAAGRSLNLTAGKGFGAGYVATQANLIDHVALDSAGVVALGKNSTFNPDFSAFTGGLRLGASANATLTGTITPAADNVYRLGGAAGTLTLATQNALTGARSLDVGTNGTAAGMVVLGNTNNYTGATTVSGGMTLGIVSVGSISTGSLTLTDGTLRLVGNADFSGLSSRAIAIGTGTIDTNGNNLSISGITGPAASVFGKTGAGTLTLNASGYAGKTVVRGGTLAIAADANLGTVPASTVADQLQLAGGTLQFTGATATIDAKRGITLGAGGGTIDTGANAVTIASTIAGSGQFTKEGSGTLTITADPNNNGGFTINGGVLALQHGGSTDGHFVINNTGTLRVLTANDLGDGFNVTVGPNATFDLRASDQIAQLLGSGTVLNDGASGTTLTVSSGVNSSFAGQMKNGASALGFTKSGSSTVTLTGTNTYTGTTLINSAALVVSGPTGAIRGSTAVNVGDNNGGGESLTIGAIGDVVSGTLDRLADNANLTLNGTSSGGFTYNGPATGSGGNVETIGTLTVSAGRNNFTLNPGTGNDVQITTGAFVRNSGGTILVRGANLGGTGVGSTRLLVTNASSALVGAGGADGTTTKSIIPFAVGDTSATGTGTGFLTHDATNGVRLLTASEYDSTIAGTASLRNVSTVGGETVSSDVKINSLRLAGTAATNIAEGTRLTVNSGAVLFTEGSTIGGAGTLEFGGTEGTIQLTKNATSVAAAINARISGSNGLNVGQASDFTTGTISLGGDNTVVGNLSVNQGMLTLGSSTALNANYPMTVLLRPNSGLGINGNSVVVRDLQGLSTTTVQNGSATAATLTNYLTAARTFSGIIQNGGTAALNLIVSGNNTLTLDTDASATGSFEQRVGTTTLTGASGTLNDFTSYAINGGTLRLTNALNSSNTNRLRDASAITFNGGTFDFDNNASGAAFSETAGAVTLNSGANTITVDRGASTSNNSTLTFASLARNAGATLNLTSQNNGTAIFDLGTTANSRLVFGAGATAPTLDNGIIGGWATIDSSATTREFVKYVSSGTVSATALAAADYTITLATGANETQNVKITASPAALTGDTQINSLNLAQASASTIDIGGKTLRVESGGIIVSGAFDASFNNGTLTAGNGASAGGDLVFHTLPTTPSTGLTWANTGDTISLANVANGRPIVFSTAPGGITAGATYYAVNSNGTTFQVAATPGGTPINITNDGTTAALTQQFPTIVNSVIADNGSNVVNLVKAGGGTLVLSGTNTYTGKTYLNGGALRIDNDSNLGGGIGSFVADKITLSSNATLEVASTMTLDANRGITVGSGTNVISIASGTAGNGKTLTYNGAITSLGTTEGSLQFKSNTSLTNVDGGKINATFSNAVNLNGSLTIDAGSVTLTGATNTIGRSLNVGADGTASLTYTGANNRLVVGKGITDTFKVGGGVGDNVANQGTLDLSGLGNLTVNVDQFQLGVATVGRTGRGVATLAINNDIVAGTAVTVGFSNDSGNNAVTSSLVFGSGVNNVMTKTFTVGGNKSVGTATVAPGGTVNLNGFGTNTLDLLVGAYGSTGVVTTAQSTFDMTGGTLNASLNRLAVGEKTGGSAGGVFGTLTIGSGNHQIVANSVTIGNVNGNNAAGTAATNGTVNFGGGDFVVNNDVSIGLWANNTVGTPTSAGTLNLTGGKFTVGGNITTSNSASATSTVNLDGGTLDLTGGTINVDNFNVKGGTLQNVAQIQNGDGTTAAPLTKTTAATLTIAGQNTYTGDTNVNAGAVMVTGAISGAVNVASGATLGGSGSIGGAVAIANGATLAPDTLGTGNLTFSGGTLDIGITNATSYEKVNVTGSVSLNAPVVLSLAVSSSFAEGTQFTIINNDGGDAISLFDGSARLVYNSVALNQGAVFNVSGDFGTQAFQISYTGGTGNDVVITAVPEPNTAAALLVAVGALTGLQRFRRRKTA
ncbi:beta strand repeat-containing protein [Verrucomicrobiota bacterium sgz303538]